MSEDRKNNMEPSEQKCAGLDGAGDMTKCPLPLAALIDDFRLELRYEDFSVRWTDGDSMSESLPPSKRNADRFMGQMAALLILGGAKALRKDDIASLMAVRHALERDGFGPGDAYWDEISAFLPKLDALLDERQALLNKVTNEQIESQRTLMRTQFPENLIGGK